MSALDAIDRRIVAATQGGLPLEPAPYRAIAETVGATEDEVLARLEGHLASGAIRRIGVIPNHYALGYQANGMSVWDVDDDAVDEIGRRVGSLDFVTHCYRRPRHPPIWRYNLFAMVHDKSRDGVLAKVDEIARIIGRSASAHDVLFSTRVLKKTGLRIGGA